MMGNRPRVEVHSDRLARVGPAGPHRFLLEPEVGRTPPLAVDMSPGSKTAPGCPTDRMIWARGRPGLASRPVVSAPVTLVAPATSRRPAIRSGRYTRCRTPTNRLVPSPADHRRPSRRGSPASSRPCSGTGGGDGVFDEHVGSVEPAGRGRIKVKVLCPGRQRARSQVETRGARAGGQRRSKRGFPRRAANSRTPGDARTSRR